MGFSYVNGVKRWILCRSFILKWIGLLKTKNISFTSTPQKKNPLIYYDVDFLLFKIPNALQLVIYSVIYIWIRNELWGYRKKKTSLLTYLACSLAIYQFKSIKIWQTIDNISYFNLHSSYYCFIIRYFKIERNQSNIDNGIEKQRTYTFRV